MLVLCRKLEEKIVIETSDGPITVTFTKCRWKFGSQPRVWLGVDAPKQCSINRPERKEATP